MHPSTREAFYTSMAFASQQQATKTFALGLLAMIPLSSTLSTAQALTNTTAASKTIDINTPRSQSLLSPSQSNIRGLKYIITPERRALLNTIRFAEGTWKDGADLGYRVMFGGSLMASLNRHPNRVIYSSRYASAAAGAYQFMPFTWNFVRNKLGISKFGPDEQDQGALYLVEYRKAMSLTDKGVMSPGLSARLAPEWASFPTLRGKSYYGQPVKSFSKLNAFHKNELASLRRARDLKRQQVMKETEKAKGLFNQGK